MNFDKFKSIHDLLEVFNTEEKCLNYLAEIRWNGNVISPFDETSRVYKCKGNKYKCTKTNKYFNAKTGTIFQDSKIPLQKWFLANYLFSSHKKGISSHQLARDLNVTQKTAWFMLHRLRVAFGIGYPDQLEGHVEVDECYIGGSQHWRHEKKKKRSKSGQVLNDKTPVIGLLQRDGWVITKHIQHIHGLADIVRQYVKPGSKISTDTLNHYNLLRNDYDHSKVAHRIGKYVREDCHTNGIENVWSHLKRGITGIYHHVSTKHLQSYLDEFSLRFNTRKISTSQRFEVILKNMVHTLKYHELIADEKAA